MQSNSSQHPQAVERPALRSGDLFGSVLLVVEAGVRYWEDATVNGQEDMEGALIPGRSGELWKPLIELATGKIRDWPKGTTADIHYKICDAGQYWLADEAGNKLAKWDGDYVPDHILAIGDSGYGDYIIMRVNADGIIEGWRQPDIREDGWERVTNGERSQDGATQRVGSGSWLGQSGGKSTDKNKVRKTRK